MSQINSDHSHDDSSSLTEAIESIKKWIIDHPRNTFLEPSRLAHELKSIPKDSLVKALILLADQGVFQRRFMVREPGGAILDQDYSSINEIPREMVTDFNDHFFEVSDQNILPVYLKLEHKQEA